MSDLNTALRSALDGWRSDDTNTDLPEPKPAITTMTTAPAPAQTLAHTSVSQQTFEHVKANPGVTTRQAVNDLAAMGLHATSVASLISQMVLSGMCKRVDQQLYMQVKYYRPIQTSKKVKKVTSKRDVVRIVTRPHPQEDAAAVSAAGIASLASKPDVAHNIKSLLDEISVNEARALYLELKKLFGGS
jgi:hypothetical protein